MPERAARLLFQLPRDCRVYTKLSPANQWGWAEIFANKTTHLLELLLWQNSYSGKNKTRHKLNKPKPFVPDFMKPQVPPSEINKESELHTVDDIRQILNLPRG